MKVKIRKQLKLNVTEVNQDNDDININGLSTNLLSYWCLSSKQGLVIYQEILKFLTLPGGPSVVLM